MGFPYQAIETKLSSVDASTSQVEIVPKDTERKGVMVYNDSSSVLWLSLHETVTATVFSFKMAAFSFFECPYGYTGPIVGLWDSETGTAKVTQFY